MIILRAPTKKVEYPYENIEGLKIPIYLDIAPHDFEKVNVPQRSDFDEKLEQNQVKVSITKSTKDPY